jgi:predicted nucleotidyltransferase component of viral defense system
VTRFPLLLNGISVAEYASDLADFADLVRAAAEWKRQRTAIVEKDYYLSRALCSLSQNHKSEFVLKGGTSLTKGWQLLQRFSEDIDVLLKAEPDWGKSRRDTRLKTLEKTVGRTKGFTYAQKPGPSETGVHRTVVFAYASAAEDVPGLSKTVRLEMGYRGDADEAVTRSVRSIITEFAVHKGMANLADDLQPFACEMQSPTLTFVEKIFAIHSAYSQNRALGRARHYYDLYELCRLAEVREFVGGDKYRACIGAVRERTREMFPGQALPVTAKLGDCEALNPGAEDSRLLERNYKLESELFFGGQPTLSEVLETIRTLLSRS